MSRVDKIVGFVAWACVFGAYMALPGLTPIHIPLFLAMLLIGFMAGGSKS